MSKAGDLDGFHSNLWLLPNEKTGLFIVSNSDGPDLREALFQAFMDHFYPSNEVQDVNYSVPESSLHSYEGLYRDIRLPAWLYDISATEKGLQVIDAYGTHTLTPVKDMLFMDEEGKLAGFKKISQVKSRISITTSQIAGPRNCQKPNLMKMCQKTIPMLRTSIV